MAGRRGREPGFEMTEEHRAKIRKSQILNRLIKYAEGDETIQYEPQRASVAMGLLGKVLPNITETKNDVTGDVSLVIRTGVPRDGD